jgi:hypothetical protein
LKLNTGKKFQENLLVLEKLPSGRFSTRKYVAAAEGFPMRFKSNQ